MGVLRYDSSCFCYEADARIVSRWRAIIKAAPLASFGFTFLLSIVNP